MYDFALDRLTPPYISATQKVVDCRSLLSSSLLPYCCSGRIYGIVSERTLMEQLDYNLLLRWHIDLNTDDPAWHPKTFTKNRDSS